MPVATYLFFFLSFVAIFSALMVIISKNAVYSVLYLIITFFAIAGHYFMLNAQFLAVVHIIVYAGAIMVLFLYIIMMMNLNKDNTEKRRNINVILIGITAGTLLLSLVYAVKGAESKMMPSIQNTSVGLVENLGMVLFNQYMIPFEVSSILFLSAMVGAVFLSKKNL
jgi:NADH-quinone oxidoreductase subunit J